jgi:hypothetical protein
MASRIATCDGRLQVIRRAQPFGMRVRERPKTLLPSTARLLPVVSMSSRWNARSSGGNEHTDTQVYAPRLNPSVDEPAGRSAPSGPEGRVDRLIGRSRAVLPSAHCPDDDGEERGLGVVLGDGAVAEFAGGGLDECEESAGRCSKW